MDFSHTPIEDSAAAYDTLARLYVSYCEPQATIDGISTMMRSGVDIEDFQNMILDTGTRIFKTREKVEARYIANAREGSKIDTSIEKNKTIAELTPHHKGTLKKKYGLQELRSMQKTTLQRCKAEFKQVEADCSDFETACLSLPETQPKQASVLFLDGHYDENDDQLTERFIGQTVLAILHEAHPYMNKTMQDVIDLERVRESYNL